MTQIITVAARQAYAIGTMREIRIHGRGGLGALVGGQMLAAASWRAGETRTPPTGTKALAPAP